jgi:hypothetical protein
MASLKALRALAPKMMPVDGRAVIIQDKYTFTANPTAADTVDFLIPGGAEVCGMDIRVDDIDTNGAPTIVFGAGYRAVDTSSTLTPSTTYFAAAGQTTAQAGGTLRCSFHPIKFEEDVYVQLTIGTASATFAAGSWSVIAYCNAVGQK